MKRLIGKHLRTALMLLLTILMTAEGVFAREVYTGGLLLRAAQGTAVSGSEGSSRGSDGIVLAKKKKKKKKKNRNQNNSQNNNQTGNQNSTQSRDQDKDQDKDQNAAQTEVTEDETYTSKEEVALYIHLYGHLPDNFITKSQAQDLGWSSREGNLDEVAPGKSIGGDRFGNYEGKLPEKSGRKYKECDIDYEGGYRTSKRIVFSDDGLIYYTEDHYETFERLY